MTGAGSASSSKDESSGHHLRSYDVFLSFTREDTLKEFTKHLSGALKQRGIKIIADEEVPQRKEVSPKAIRSAEMSIVIFSKNYASSRRCLNELTEILKRKETEVLKFMPIFYDVKPCDVRNQTGPYTEAFVDHELNCKDEVKRWRTGLYEASRFIGYEVTADKADSHLKNIVSGVLSELNSMWFQSSANLVGMGSHLAAVGSLLNLETKDVRMVGICGMGGIGKTTLAKAIYNEFCCFFRHRAILENVGETCGESSQRGLLKLQQRLLSQIMGEMVEIRSVDEGSDMIRQNCCSKKMLLVIDDVNHGVQLEKLAGGCDWFGPSSRIILTTRDRSLLYNHEEMILYEVPLLKAADACQLFTRIAFQGNENMEAYEGIINGVLQYAQGLPLVITVLGDLFRRIPKNEWQSTLQVLKSDLYEIDDRCRKLVELLPLPTSIQNLVVHGCSELAELPLLPLTLESLVVDGCSELAEFELLPSPSSLPSLDIDGCSELEVAELPLLPPSLQRLDVNDYSKLANLLLLPPSLKSLDVKGCNELAKLPPMPPSLQILVITRCINLAELPPFPPILRRLNVMGCDELVMLPPLPPSLQILVIHGCRVLVELPPLPFNLRSLDVDGCSELAKLPPLPPGLHSFVVNGCPKLVELSLLPNSLQSLVVVGCTNLVELPSSAPRYAQCSGNLVLRLFWRSCLRLYSNCLQSRVRVEIISEFFVDKIAVDELPPSIENLVALKGLCFHKCRNIKTLPSTIYRLQNLQRFHLNGCSKLVKFPEYEDGSNSSSSTSTHKPLSLPNATYIDLQGCRLREINFVKDLDCISTLKNFDISGNEVVMIPESISRLTALQHLNLENCKQLREILGLPPNLKYLFAKGCKSLEWYVPLSRMLRSHSIDSPRFRQIDFSGCIKLSQGDSSLANFFSIEDMITDSQIKILHPGSEIPKWFRYKSMEGSISFSIDSKSCQNIAGLAFCVVIGLEGRQRSEASISCQMEVFINDQRTFGFVDFFKSLGSDHMWLMYVPSPLLCGWNTRMQDQCNEFKVLFELSKGTLKCCGVHLALKKDRQAREPFKFTHTNFARSFTAGNKFRSLGFAFAIIVISSLFFKAILYFGCEFVSIVIFSLSGIFLLLHCLYGELHMDADPKK